LDEYRLQLLQICVTYCCYLSILMIQYEVIAFQRYVSEWTNFVARRWLFQNVRCHRR